MKKIVAIIFALAMIFTSTATALAADTTAAVKMTSSKIKAITPKNVTAASCSLTKIKVSWNKIEGVDGYAVYRASNKSGTYKKIYTTANPDKLSYINTGRSTGKTYYYKIRGFKKIGKATCYTRCSAVISAYARPTRAKITKVIIPYYEYGKAKEVTETYGSTVVTRNVWDSDIKYIDKGFTVKWNAVSGATGYQLYMREKGKTTWTNKGYCKGTSAAEIAFNDEKEYEFKVRAYKNVNGKKVYGLFSPVSSYQFTWDMSDIKAYMEDVIRQKGYIAADEKIDRELGYEITEPVTPANAGWSFLWPKRLSRYYSFEYATKYIIHGSLVSDIDEFRSDFCAFVCEAAANTAYNPWGDPGKKVPLHYEAYLLQSF
ncbi:MAG: hypothetical protein ACI4LA_08140 [Emergencia sp.]